MPAPLNDRSRGNPSSAPRAHPPGRGALRAHVRSPRGSPRRNNLRRTSLADDALLYVQQRLHFPHGKRRTLRSVNSGEAPQFHSHVAYFSAGGG